MNLLRALYDYAEERLDLPPEMYVERPIAYYVDLDREGALKGVVEAGERSISGRSAPEIVAVPRLAVNRSGVKPNPLLMADNGEYALGISRRRGGTNLAQAAKEEEKVRARHEAFVELGRECLRETGDPDVRSVVSFLGHRIGQIEGALPEDFDPSRMLAFRIAGRPVVERGPVREFWVEHTRDDDLPIGRCVVTGRIGPVVKRLPGSITGIPGGQPSGMKLHSVNKPAFESYGLEAASNLQISREAATKVDAALNHLLHSRAHSFRVGETVYLFWSRSPRRASGEGASDPQAAAVSSLLERPAETVVDALFGRSARPDRNGVGSNEKEPRADSRPERSASITGGGGADVPDGVPDGTLELSEALVDAGGGGGFEGARLNILIVSATASRVVVRAFATRPTEQVLDNLRRWFSAQRLASPFANTDRPTAGGPAPPLAPRGIYGILAATFPRSSDVSRILSKAPGEPVALVRSAVEGTPPPRSLVLRALARCRKERGVPAGIAQLMRLNLTTKGVIRMDQLERPESEPDLTQEEATAYQLGRLLAQLESIQRASLGRSVNRSLVDRYYGLASTQPSRTFGKILGDAHQHHLRKLQKRRGGLYKTLDAGLKEIHEKLPVSFPARLSVDQQQLFAIGFYHQQSANRDRATAAVRRGEVRREAGGG